MDLLRLEETQRAGSCDKIAGFIIQVAQKYYHLRASAYQSGPLSLVEECRGSALIGRDLQLLRQLSYAIKNQLRHPKPPFGFGTQRPNGSLLAPRWFFMA